MNETTSVSCSPDPTTDSETMNPNFTCFTNLIFYLKNIRIDYRIRENYAVTVAELVSESGEQKSFNFVMRK